MSKFEFVEVSLEDDDESDLEAGDTLVEVNDPGLNTVLIKDDAEADAYKKFAVLRVRLDNGGSITIQR
jgi:hypothetical protein